MTLSDLAFVVAMRIMPKKPVSRGVRRLASIPSALAIERFAARYGAAIEEAEKPIGEYSSLLEFFTRRLKPEARPIIGDEDALVCPVDGAFLAGGPVGKGRLFQAKGREFTLGALLADEEAERRFEAGTYAILYLAPGDYHRIHAPVSGDITGYTYVPGTLFPVNRAAMEGVDGVLARNERLITHIASPRFGRVDVVKVGAMCVGHIRATYDAAIRTNTGATDIARHRYAVSRPVLRGDEIGVFEMGSTVVVVVEHSVALRGLAEREPVRMGTMLGRVSA